MFFRCSSINIAFEIRIGAQLPNARKPAAKKELHYGRWFANSSQHGQPKTVWSRRGGRLSQCSMTRLLHAHSALPFRSCAAAWVAQPAPGMAAHVVAATDRLSINRKGTGTCPDDPVFRHRELTGLCLP
jgi:hypothetical protein